MTFEGEEIEDARDLARHVAGAKPHRSVELEVWRGGKLVELDVALGESPDAQASIPTGSRDGAQESVDGLGLALAPMTDDDRERYGTDGALVVDVEPDSPAARRGIRRGDVIVRVGQTEVSTPDEVAEEVERLRDDERSTVVLQIARGDQRQFLAVPLA